MERQTIGRLFLLLFCIKYSLWVCGVFCYFKKVRTRALFSSLLLHVRGVICILYWLHWIELYVFPFRFESEIKFYLPTVIFIEILGIKMLALLLGHLRGEFMRNVDSATTHIIRWDMKYLLVKVVVFSKCDCNCLWCHECYHCQVDT